MTGEPHAYHIWNGAMSPSYINYCLKSEVSITLHCQLCSTCYTAFRIKNLSGSTSTIYAYQKKWCHSPQLYQLSSEKWTIHYASLSAMFNPLHNNTNQELLKSTLAIKIATMKNTEDFCFEGKPSRARAKSTPFPVNKDEWDTKEDTGKSMKNALYVLWYAKRHLSGRSDVKQWKHQACSFSRYHVMLVWRHQSVSYLLT